MNKYAGVSHEDNNSISILSALHNLYRTFLFISALLDDMKTLNVRFFNKFLVWVGLGWARNINFLLYSDVFAGGSAIAIRL